VFDAGAGCDELLEREPDRIGEVFSFELLDRRWWTFRGRLMVEAWTLQHPSANDRIDKGESSVSTGIGALFKSSPPIPMLFVT
jgi:hypothetical protein